MPVSIDQLITSFNTLIATHILEMAFGQEALEQLSRELLGGLSLNTRLLALLGIPPLDGRGQEAAVAISQELSEVFRNLMVSLFMLKSGDISCGVVELKTPSPKATVTEGSVDQRTPARYKRIRYTTSLIRYFLQGGWFVCCGRGGFLTLLFP